MAGHGDLSCSRLDEMSISDILGLALAIVVAQTVDLEILANQMHHGYFLKISSRIFGRAILPPKRSCWVKTMHAFFCQVADS